MENQRDYVVILVKVKTIHTEEVEGEVITGSGKLTKAVIQEDKLVTHKQ